MKILALDTSTRFLTVACSDASGLIAEFNFSGAFQHSENLIHLIDSALKSLKLKFEEVEVFAAGLGPGSFTGLRIGFSVLKGFRAAASRPIYGISSLDLIASGVSLPNGRLGVIVNARRERIYASFYEFKNGLWQRENQEDEVLTVEELVRRNKGDICWTGDALADYGKMIRENNAKAVLFESNFWYPRANHLVRLIASRYKEMRPLEGSQLKPVYLRLSEAEEKKHGNLHTSDRTI